MGAGALERERKMKGLPLVFLGHRQYYDGYDSIVLLVGTGCVHHVWLVCYLLVVVLPSKLDLQEHQQDKHDKHHGLQLHAEDSLQSGLQTLSCYSVLLSLRSC